MIEINNCEYNLVKNYRDGFDQDALMERVTDFFYDYDYIFGDWAYGKLRLKGFYKSDSKKKKSLNDIKGLDDYIKNNCAYDCKYFLIEKK